MMFAKFTGLVFRILSSRRATGYRDETGRMIFEGDVLVWTIKAGWRNPYGEPSFASTIAYLFDLPPNTVTEDTTTISRVVRERGEWLLRGVGKDRGWVTQLHSEKIHRNEMGYVVDLN